MPLRLALAAAASDVASDAGGGDVGTSGTGDVIGVAKVTMLVRMAAGASASAAAWLFVQSSLLLLIVHLLVAKLLATLRLGESSWGVALITHSGSGAATWHAKPLCAFLLARVTQGMSIGLLRGGAMHTGAEKST
jgi:hypothetical protein